MSRLLAAWNQPDTDRRKEPTSQAFLIRAVDHHVLPTIHDIRGKRNRLFDIF
jgi:hypothetical protein